MQGLDLEEAANDQYADQEGKPLHRIERALLFGIARRGLVGGFNIGDFNIVHTAFQILPYFNFGSRVLQLDCQNIGQQRGVVIGYIGFRSNFIPDFERHKYRGLEEILPPVGDATDFEFIEFIFGALSGFDNDCVANLQVGLPGNAPVNDGCFRLFGAQGFAFKGRRRTGFTRLHTD